MAFIRCFLENGSICLWPVIRSNYGVFLVFLLGFWLLLLLVSDLKSASIAVLAETCINSIDS